jgi:hypothetical protein
LFEFAIVLTLCLGFSPSNKIIEPIGNPGDLVSVHCKGKHNVSHFLALLPGCRYSGLLAGTGIGSPVMKDHTVGDCKTINFQSLIEFRFDVGRLAECRGEMSLTFLIPGARWSINLERFWTDGGTFVTEMLDSVSSEELSTQPPSLTCRLVFE